MLEQLKTRLLAHRRTRETMRKRDKKCTKIAGFTVKCEEKMVSFKSLSVWEKVSLKGFGWFYLIHLDQVWARIGQFRPESVRS